MQSLFQVPLASNTINQLHLSTLALACLIRQLYVQGNTAIRKQELAIMIQAYYAVYKQEIVNPLNSRKNVRTELVYNSVWRHYSTKFDKWLPDRDNCEILIKEVANNDFHFANQLQLELQKKTLELIWRCCLKRLKKINGGLRQPESLKTEPESPAKSGEGGVPAPQLTRNRLLKSQQMQLCNSSQSVRK
jgi:hypothetical protein